MGSGPAITHLTSGLAGHDMAKGTPVGAKARRLAPDKLIAAKQEFQKISIHKKGICSPSTSCWANPLVMHKRLARLVCVPRIRLISSAVLFEAKDDKTLLMKILQDLAWLIEIEIFHVCITGGFQGLRPAVRSYPNVICRSSSILHRGYPIAALAHSAGSQMAEGHAILISGGNGDKYVRGGFPLQSPRRRISTGQRMRNFTVMYFRSLPGENL
ncbi:hypothetical protein AVEN_252749-1 [Araneus ventricosus]|uniref:Uncharacterized protein n=1 Tax=Araneus ventricosus TaxID=182803 RepID=A0A4Y2JVH1_ARAVE|nr:hypothetical protein AVEN_252749-1 [Araneus ventricosus]